MLGGFSPVCFLSPGALTINTPITIVSSFDANLKYQTLAFFEDPGSREGAQGCLGVHRFDSSVVSTLVAGADHLR